MTKRIQWIIAVALGSLCSPILAQDSLGTIKVDVRLVEVYATVLDNHGSFVDGLKADNFRDTRGRASAKDFDFRKRLRLPFMRHFAGYNGQYARCTAACQKLSG